MSAKQVQVLSAHYGAGDSWWDVTGLVASFVDAEGRLIFGVGGGTLGGDPASGKVKSLRLVYTTGRRKRRRTFVEGKQVNLP